MRKFSRFFVFLLFIGLLSAHAPMTRADMQQQGYGTMRNAAPITRADESQYRSYGSKVGKKTLNTFANLVGSMLEIPKNIINVTNQSNIFFGLSGGLAKGIIYAAGRIGAGVADLVTIPLPTKPIAYPEYIWDDFDVDTTFGPVFRLDESQAPEPAVVQAPVAESVAAPAVAAPKPQPIDNSKQYSQETNQKLDTMFKKEMSK
jgi:putative exosortase-associated protein (TIGR04073 family)